MGQGLCRLVAGDVGLRVHPFLLEVRCKGIFEHVLLLVPNREFLLRDQQGNNEHDR